MGYRNIIRTLLALFMLVMTAGAKAQEADVRIGKLLNSNDWFALEREYPTLRDGVQTPVLRLMAEALLGYYFNRPDETVVCVDSLLRHHQAELGLGNITSMLTIKAIAESRRGNYGAAADMMKSFASQLMAQGVEMDYSGINQVAGHFDKFRSLRPMTVERPGGDAVIRMTNDSIVLKIENDTVPRGTTMHVSVTVGGRECRAIFDTGAGLTFMSAELAGKMGVRVVSDSLHIQGAGLVFGQVGVIDSMVMGGITIRNIPVAINPDTTLNRLHNIDFLIGTDVMTQFGELRIYPHEGRIVVPKQRTPRPAEGSNMYMDNMSPIIEGEIGGRTYGFFLDTGNGSATLSPAFYERNKAEIDMTAKRVKRMTGGIGSVEDREMLLLPTWTFALGGRDVTLRDVGVMLEDSKVVHHDGNIGMSLVNQFDKVTINFKECFAKFE